MRFQPSYIYLRSLSIRKKWDCKISLIWWIISHNVYEHGTTTISHLWLLYIYLTYFWKVSWNWPSLRVLSQQYYLFINRESHRVYVEDLLRETLVLTGIYKQHWIFHWCKHCATVLVDDSICCKITVQSSWSRLMKTICLRKVNGISMWYVNNRYTT